MSGMTTEMTKLMREVRRAGYNVTKAYRGGHYRVDTPDGPVFCSVSPSKPGVLQAVKADLRRKGVKL